MIADTAANVFAGVDKKADTNVMIRQCGREPDFACYADQSAIYCREEPLAQLARMAAWLSAETAFLFDKHRGKKGVLNEVPQLSWVDALLLADAEAIDGETVFTQRAEMIMERRDLDADSLNAIYSLVVDIYSHTNNRQAVDPDNQVLLVASDIYQQIMEYAFAFLLGHEGFHYTKDVCEVSRKSRIETNGLVNEVSKMQLKGGYFNPALTLDKNEFRADICGLRWMEKIAENAEADMPAVFDALSKRLAIDLLSAPLLAGYLNSIAVNKLGQAAPKAKLVSGYLYPQSRLILTSAVLNLSEAAYPETVKICNDSAKAMATLMQDAYQSYPKSSGIISDPVLAQLPPGVEKAWNGAMWKEDSFRCYMEKK
ncbi:hypothetical protein [Pseudoteredinibacter isoporae]|uniref:hypothetical protein n=1 Tax=Pseudoteredinibacter isoporae TaxID=570281 RepID=UPI00333F96B6